ncbi:PREDICTED: uncharacterized protein LOC104605590 isoform X1 [Nelumbo nucifera]|uniref:Uncharacterized protein LOC104605590 isoform X1 n=1 Tax=Nelumbo nucifera TaxID=4432 RepID=A0A1U8ALR1_NELNU|nr:PREDICTED: uncharacterized protein LOC104605590 isoform X1 [Nelumbo nucifera]
MENETLTTTTAEEQLSMFYRRFLHPSRGFHHVLVLSCILFRLATCEPCSTRNNLVLQPENGMQNPLEYDAYESYGGNYDACFQDNFASDVSSSYVWRSSPSCMSLKVVCANSEFFCFPSTLSGHLSEEDNTKESHLEVTMIGGDVTLPGKWFSRSMLDVSSSQLLDHGQFKLLNGRIVSCSLNSRKGLHDVSYLQYNGIDWRHLASCRGYGLRSSIGKNLEANKRSGALHGSSIPEVEINPPSLDWGQKYLYFPSLSFLTVANTHNDSILHIYEPFSTDTQFYPCDSDELVLGPGEVATICFVFLPRWPGLSSAHVVLQTSSGGFLIHAKGFAMESPYRIQPLLGLNISSSGRYRQNLTLYNPFDGTLIVEEVIAWISFSSGNISHSEETSCKMDTSGDSDKFNSFLNGKEWLDIKSGQDGFPQVGIRPLNKWEIDPHGAETIMEIDFSSSTEGKVFGAFCLHLQNSSLDRIDTLIVPLEAEVHGKEAYSGLMGLVSIFLEVLLPCDVSEIVNVALSVRNGAPDLLSIVKISEVAESTNLFNIEYLEGLILFPGTVTQIAMITYTPPVDPLPEKSSIYLNCKLLILTNGSVSPQIEIPCQDIAYACSRRMPDSYIEYKLHPEEEQSRHEKTGALRSSIPSPSQLKAMKTAGTDELVLKNWRSQGTSGMSVLDDHEILFPIVQVGTHCSKWITVKNPSQKPVIMQLLLNSAIVIDQCKTPDESLQPSFSCSLLLNDSITPRYGFSIADNAVTEAYVHPYGRALFGPIIFHPSHRCGWRSSVLIRNNLSGVEWLPLQGFGGSFSLALLEGSEPVQRLEFKLHMPIPLNVSHPEFLFHKEDTNSICFQPLLKELYAKNTGDLPLVVKRIEVSGSDCQLDGFMVHTCKGFALEPGESVRLLISYQTDFSAAVVHRDLELALATGIFVIPMKASLPVDMLNICKKSFLWILVIKFSLIFLAAALLFLVFFCILPQPMSLVAFDYLFKNEKTSIITIGRAGKSRVHRNQRNSRFSMYENKNSPPFNRVGEDETSELGFFGRCSDCSSGDQGIISPHTKLMQNNQEETIDMLEPQKEEPLLSSSSVLKSVALIENSGLVESSHTGSLKVRIEKEKGRRRRKRRPVGGIAGLTGTIEVSSSQSGNSTPSSPLSPVISFTPKQMWSLSPSPDIDNGIESRSPFATVAGQTHYHEKGQIPEVTRDDRLLEPEISPISCNNNCLLSAKEQPSVLRKASSKPVLLPSATFPSAGRLAPYVTSPPFLTSTSAISPDARAPGSKPVMDKSIRAEEKGGLGDEFTYDIWGNHFSGFHLTSRTKDIATMISTASEGNSDSFFVRGPLILTRKSQMRSESPDPKLSKYAASCHHQKDSRWFVPVETLK